MAPTASTYAAARAEMRPSVVSPDGTEDDGDDDGEEEEEEEEKADDEDE